MIEYFKRLVNRRRNILIIIIITGFLISFLSIFKLTSQEVEAELAEFIFEEELVIAQGNSLLPISDPCNPELQAIRKIKVVVTAYSSSPWETDGNPYLTAAGTWVKDGVVANNLLPFGTKVRLPELYGDKVFVVEDRMNWKKGYYHIDIWFPSYGEAKNFGSKRTYIEVLES